MDGCTAKLAIVLILVLTVGRSVAGQDDVADIASTDLRIGGDEQKRYFLIGPRADDSEEGEGFGLVVVIPGGDGSDEFHAFVKRIFKHAIPAGYLVAQPVAIKSTDEAGIVWPTAKDRTRGVKRSTEEFVEAVINDVRKKHKLNSQHIYTLSWSSSGPAAYAISLTSKQVRGSLVAMSVFKPDRLPSLKKSKDHAYYIYHSPDDQVCPYRMAEQAAKELEKSGAHVKLVQYAGGHGWHGNLFDEIRQGIEWLADSTDKPTADR